MFRGFVYLCALGLVGCATPAERFVQRALEHGLERSEQRGLGFNHTLFTHPARGETAGLHIYLDGDGTPWIGLARIATDPSSRDPVVLDWMSRDRARSVLVGRPCYYQTPLAAGCAPALWTSHRYSEEIVASMAAAIDKITKDTPAIPIWLIGYSGGGALAMLVAPRLQRLDGVITVAANLDTAAWIAHHRYAPLVGSLNPADLPRLNPALPQLHLYGGLDTNVPVTTVARYFANAEQSPEILSGFNHACCWAARWGWILNQFAAASAQ
ncbi:MAG: serine aminopeptidase domain-containing protein [Gammaproteobacteria bacterium]